MFSLEMCDRIREQWTRSLRLSDRLDEVRQTINLTLIAARNDEILLLLSHCCGFVLSRLTFK